VFCAAAVPALRSAISKNANIKKLNLGCLFMIATLSVKTVARHWTAPDALRVCQTTPSKDDSFESG
jgi:hypothetical protein